MRARELFEQAHTTSPIFRWVDDKAAKSYMRIDAMKGRVRHWLPKQISGLDKIYAKTGLSFSYELGKWMDVGGTIGFVVDQTKLDNHIVPIAGHEVFIFSGMADWRKEGACSYDSFEKARDYAIKTSLERPDEAFVIGDIRGLSSKLTKVLFRDEAARMLMAPYCEQHNIPLENYR